MTATISDRCMDCGNGEVERDRARVERHLERGNVRDMGYPLGVWCEPCREKLSRYQAAMLPWHASLAYAALRIRRPSEAERRARAVEISAPLRDLDDVDVRIVVDPKATDPARRTVRTYGEPDSPR